MEEPRMLRRPGPLAELESILKVKSPEARKERLVQFTAQHPSCAPGWVALANEHMEFGRKEEAIPAARRALGLSRVNYEKFSVPLQNACRHLVPAPESEARSGEPVVKAPQFVSNTSRGRGTGRLSATIAKIRALGDGRERWAKLQQLTLDHPDQGEAWLGVAEEALQVRRFEEAMSAAQRAIRLDPPLEGRFSPKLGTAFRLHQAGYDEHGKRQVPRYSAGAARRNAGRAQKGRQGQPSPVSPAPWHKVGATEESVDRMLEVALAVQDPNERLSSLKLLMDDVAPYDPSVLFHYAQTAELAGERHEAVSAAAKLQKASPQRYKEFYQWADAHLKSHGKATAGPPRSQSSPPPQPPNDAPRGGGAFDPVLPVIETHAVKGVTLALPSARSEPEPARLAPPPQHAASPPFMFVQPAAIPTHAPSVHPAPYPMAPRRRALSPRTQVAIAIVISLCTGLVLAVLLGSLF